MQVLYETELTFDEYREQKAWEHARLDRCPVHPEGGCGFARHGSYERKYPEPCKIARYYCSAGQVTIGLLPVFFASRFPGTLDEVEDAVNVAESCQSKEEAAMNLRPDILYPFCLRWLQRCLKYVEDILKRIAGLFPDAVSPNLESFRKWLECDRVLCNLRRKARDHLHSLPPIVGLVPHSPI